LSEQFHISTALTLAKHTPYPVYMRPDGPQFGLGVLEKRILTLGGVERRSSGHLAHTLGQIYNPYFVDSVSNISWHFYRIVSYCDCLASKGRVAGERWTGKDMERSGVCVGG
jgi:hypothetical protein